MTADTLERLNILFAEFPIMRADSLPSQAEVMTASRDIGILFDPDYQHFLRRYGCGMVGPYPIYGLRPVPVMGLDRWSVVDLTRELRAQGIPGTDGWIVISEDHASNPVGLDKDGKIWIHDHDFGGIDQLTESFEEYIRVFCLKI